MNIVFVKSILYTHRHRQAFSALKELVDNHSIHILQHLHWNALVKHSKCRQVCPLLIWMPLSLQLGIMQ